MHKVLQLGIAAFAALSTFSGQADAADFKVDPAKSELVVRTWIDGIGSSIGHDHVIRATQFSGKVSFDEAAGTGSISVEAKSGTMKVDETATRKKYGLPGELSAKDQAEIEGNMRGEDQLHTAKHPTISFQSTKVQKQANGTYMVTGNLTIRGKTNQISFPATVEMKGGNFVAKGKVRFKQSSFGYEPYSALLGALKNKDEVEMHMEITGMP